MAAVIVAVSVGCGDGSAVGTTTAAPRALDTSGATSSTLAVEAVPLTDPLGDNVALAPGTYETQLTVRPVRFTLGEGWYLDYQAPWSTVLTREPTTGTRQAGVPVLGVTFLSEVTLPDDPLAGVAGAEDATLTPFTGEIDYVDWLAGIRGVTLTDRHPVRVAGMDGTGFDMEVGALPERSDCGDGSRCVGLWESGGFFGLADEGDRYRMDVLGAGADQIRVGHTLGDSEFEAEADEVVASLEFG